MGCERYISSSFDPGSIKHTAVVKKCRRAELWEETSLFSFGDNTFLAKGLWSAALGVWKMLVEMLEPRYAPVLFASEKCQQAPRKSDCRVDSVISPEGRYRCIAHCGEEGEILKGH